MENLVPWSKQFEQCIAQAASIFSRGLREQKEHPLTDADKESLWNALNNAGFLCDELATLLHLPNRVPASPRTRAPKSPVKVKTSPAPKVRVMQARATQAGTKKKRTKKRHRSQVADGYCEGCETYKTGAQAVYWRLGDTVGYNEETKKPIRQNLCNACGLKWDRKRRRELNKNK